MAKIKVSAKEEINETVLEQPYVNELKTTEGNIQSEFEQQKNDSLNVEDAFREFETKKSGYVADDQVIPEVNKIVNGVPTFEQKMKVKMFAGFIFFLLVGVNVFILNKIKGTKVPSDKMQLTEDELETFSKYLESPEVIAMIDKLPAWLIGTMHFEMVMIQKHKDLADEYRPIVPAKMEEIKMELGKTPE